MSEEQANNPSRPADSGRNTQGSLTTGQVIAYLNGWENAPPAQEVFDHYWSILEYALLDEEKDRIRTASLEEGVKLLYALGGEVWNTYPDVDLMCPYEYLEKDGNAESAVGSFTFSLPKRPIDNLRAGLALGQNMSFYVIDQHCQYDFTFERSVHVYRDGDLVDILNINLEYDSIYIPFKDRVTELGISQEVVDAEVEWAARRNYKWKVRESGRLRFTDYFHDVEVLKDLYSVEKILSIELWGCLGTFDERLQGAELERYISGIVDGSILGYLIRNWGEKDVGDFLRTPDIRTLR